MWVLRRRVSWVLAVVGLVALGGCVATKTDCNDGLDNDGDGKVDEVDYGCVISDGVTEVGEVACNDLFDNDMDGLIDGMDYGCDSANPQDDDEADPIRACNDMVDNDGDFLIDFPDDPGCMTPVDDDEFNPAQCQDTMDNDGDGLMDYPFEPGCDSPEDDDETDPATRPPCSDAMDNDGDGATDLGDIGCVSAADNEELNVTIGACGPSVVITDISSTRMAMGAVTGPLPNELSSDVCRGFGGAAALP